MSYMEPFFSLSTFNEILPIWSQYLWPGRLSPIEPVSCINSNSEIDVNIMSYSPVFAKIAKGSQILAVSSIHQTGFAEFRLRGNWVSEQHRGQGYGKNIITQLMEVIPFKSGDFVWTMARLHNKDFYKKIGFSEDYLTEKFEFGPHCVMKRILS
jgi:predicted GNAT family N-acyltransferase